MKIIAFFLTLKQIEQHEIHYLFEYVKGKNTKAGYAKIL